MDALPDGTHLLHIGPQKTGSTTIQAALHRSRAVLRDHGVIYPGPGPRPKHALHHGLGFSVARGGPKGSEQEWQDLLAQVHDPAARVAVVSHEAFGRADNDQIRRVVETLGGDRPHVVAVARRLDRLMPSQWQQRVKAKLTLSYDEWLGVVLGEPDPEHPVWRNLWVPHDTVTLLRRWAGPVGAENVTLIVGDEADRDLLPRTFEALLGVPCGTLDLRAGARNRSLSYGEVELLRHLNRRFEGHRRWSAADYFALVHQGVIPALVQAERDPADPPIPPLPRWAFDRLVEVSEQRLSGLAELREAGLRIIGDVERLRLRPEEAPAADAATEPLVRPDLAARALEGMAAGALRRRGKGEAAGPSRQGKRGKRGRKGKKGAPDAEGRARRGRG